MVPLERMHGLLKDVVAIRSALAPAARTDGDVP